MQKILLAVATIAFLASGCADRSGSAVGGSSQETITGSGQLRGDNPDARRSRGISGGKGSSAGGSLF